MPKSVNRGLTKAALARGSHRAPWFRWLARGSALAVTTAALIGMPSGARAATSPVPLGTAANFAVLAGSTITNTGATTINGDLGAEPGHIGDRVSSRPGERDYPRG
jgi:hypothetical protein